MGWSQPVALGRKSRGIHLGKHGRGCFHLWLTVELGTGVEDFGIRLILQVSTFLAASGGRHLLLSEFEALFLHEPERLDGSWS